MPKKNSLSSKEYWEKREAYKLKKGLKDLKKIEKELVEEYKKAMNEIGKEISNLFYKYANDNNLSFSDAKKYLNSSEFREFKRDLKSYIKLIEATGDEELLLELNTLAMKSRISRLEEMFYQCGKYINEVYENTNKRLTVVYSSTIKDNYYQTIFDIHKSIGVGVSFSYIDNDMIKEILAFPWSGRHYSKNLWINRTKLKNAMVQELTQMIIQGKGVKETSPFSIFDFILNYDFVLLALLRMKLTDDKVCVKKKRCPYSLKNSTPGRICSTRILNCSTNGILTCRMWNCITMIFMKSTF